MLLANIIGGVFGGVVGLTAASTIFKEDKGKVWKSTIMTIVVVIGFVVISKSVGEDVEVVEELLREVSGETFVEVKEGSKIGGVIK